MSKVKPGMVHLDIPGDPTKHIKETLAGWDIIGEVTDHVGTGALVREKGCGVYARANTHTIWSLPQEVVRDALANLPTPSENRSEAMSEKERDEEMKEVAFNSMGWGYTEVPADDT